MMNKKFQIIAFMWMKGMNQTTLAKQVGCSESRLSRILNSHVLPSKTETEAIAKALSVCPSKVEKMMLGGGK